MKALSARALRGALAGLLAACVLPLGALAQDLVPVGEAVGIEASTAGLLVASLARVSTPSGEACPARRAVNWPTVFGTLNSMSDGNRANRRHSPPVTPRLV